jgi:hypothetical protein
MTKKIELNAEQTKAYNRFIMARDRVGKGKQWVKPSEISHSIEVAGLNHPLYVVNDDYVEYQEAFKNWLMVEPQFREKERMRASRGDYEGLVDNWDENTVKVKEL